MADDIYLDEIARNWEEEGLFARDVDGRLIRVVERTEQDYLTLVTVVIDGQEIVVPKAVPSTDAQGNIVYVDASGRTVPRATTIYDAARRLYERLNAEQRAANPDCAPLEIPIPTLCHLDHLRPAGVCRVCSVAAETFEIGKDGTRKPKRQEKLVPACVQPVEPNMVVHTLSSPDEKQRSKVAASVKVLLELLAADHLSTNCSSSAAQASQTDLERVVARLSEKLKLDLSRFRPPQPVVWPRDESSPLVSVDHSACILCDRCVRACTEVKQNFVIGRTGKGYTAGIGFDLDDPMGHSSCVECGECMLSCPTSALTFRQPVVSAWFLEQVGENDRGGRPGRTSMTPEEMESNVLLRTLPWRYRQWNQSSIVRWKVKPGDELCRLGEYGSTAFILNAGSFGVWLQDPRAGGRSNGSADLGPPRFVMRPDDLLLGEMTCLNQYPRNATVRALEAGEVFEIRRNVLFTPQRNPEARSRLDAVYRARSISNHLRRVPLFASLTDDERKTCEQMLLAGDEAIPLPPGEGDPSQSDRVRGDSAPPIRAPVDLVRVEPGQIIYRQGERADCFYMIRFGHVKVTQTYGGEERVLNYLGLNQSFGEIACIGNWPELRSAIPPELQGPLDNRRSASCIALDHVELVRIDAAVFRQLLQALPPLKAALVQQAKDYLSRQAPPQPGTGNSTPVPASSPPPAALAQFCDQGLYNAQRLLVLDLEACTRCDECTKACSDTHQGITRLIREGLRFDKWLVASSCRSCTDPYCLLGCPVDAIHRDGRHLEIRIENHCIGCGLCASNCPYGNINMHLAEAYDPQEGRKIARHHATTCDLCTDIVGDDFRNVSCVFACPHNAAFRMTGKELLKTVQS